MVCTFSQNIIQKHKTPIKRKLEEDHWKQYSLKWIKSSVMTEKKTNIIRQKKQHVTSVKSLFTFRGTSNQSTTLCFRDDLLYLYHKL